MQNTKIFLVRHGQTLWNLEDKWQGNKNSDLTELGINQANKTKQKLDKYKFVRAYVSPLQRAQDTIKIILDKQDILYTIIDELKEINLGIWEGHTKDETKNSHEEQFENFWQKPQCFSLENAESFEQLQKRVVACLNNIFSENQGENILVVSHWIAIKVALAFYMKKPISHLPYMDNPKNAEVYCLEKS